MHRRDIKWPVWKREGNVMPPEGQLPHHLLPLLPPAAGAGMALDAHLKVLDAHLKVYLRSRLVALWSGGKFFISAEAFIPWKSLFYRSTESQNLQDVRTTH